MEFASKRHTQRATKDVVVSAVIGVAAFLSFRAFRKLRKRYKGRENVNEWKNSTRLCESVPLEIGLLMRDMRGKDYDLDVVPLLAQLTKVGTISKEFFLKRQKIFESDPLQRIVVIEDVRGQRLLATGTLCIEPKFIHKAGFAGHLEDVVVDSKFRGKGLGSMVVRKLISLAKDFGCYKVILDCKKENVPFYRKLGFFEKEVQMALYFPDTETNDELALAQFMTQKDDLGNNLVVRQLAEKDFERGGFVELLSQLTTVGKIPKDFMKKRLQMLRQSNRELMYVIEDTKKEKLVAAGTLLVEYKFIHSVGKCGHIEDIVVDKTERGRGLGKKIVCKLRDAARKLGVYKCILDCSRDNVGFYVKCGFHEKEVCMALYLDGSH